MMSSKKRQLLLTSFASRRGDRKDVLGAKRLHAQVDLI
jgi:hypothetical protein